MGRVGKAQLEDVAAATDAPSGAGSPTLPKFETGVVPMESAGGGVLRHVGLPGLKAAGQADSVHRKKRGRSEIRLKRPYLQKSASIVSATALLLSAISMPCYAAVPTQGLVASYNFNGNANDSSGRGHHGTIHNAYLTSNRLGNGSSAYSFNGTNAYVEVPDHNDFSLPTTGRLSISVWMRPGTLTFPDIEGTGYVHWMGKGSTNRHEWTFRMYSLDNTEGRENRVSFYLFNLSGGLGAGSYVQEPVTPGTWYHYVAIADMSTDRITWYKNGVLKDQDPFINSPYKITPRNGTAPMRLGTRDFASFFKGAIDNINIYNRSLSPSDVQQLYLDRTP
jgi:hypothetical protein